MVKSQGDTKDEHEWRSAADLVQHAHVASPGFASAIRFLRKDAECDNTLSPSSIFLMRRYLACPSIMAPMYYATLTYFEDQISKKKKIFADDILACYQPDLLSVMLFTIYLSGHLRRITDAEEWQKVVQRLQQYAELSVPFGMALPELGPARALLIGVMRQLSFGVFSCADHKGFKEYRRKLVTKKSPDNLSEERQLWGCTHYHVSSLLTQALGLGMEFANAILPVALALGREHASKEAMLVKVTMSWLDALVLTGSPPKQQSGDDIVISEQAIDRLYEVVVRFQKGATHNWLLKRSADISKETHPQLFSGGSLIKVAPPKQGAKKVSGEDMAGDEYQSLPQEFRELFPSDEFKSLLGEIGQLMEDVDE